MGKPPVAGMFGLIKGKEKNIVTRAQANNGYFSVAIIRNDIIVGR